LLHNTVRSPLRQRFDTRSGRGRFGRVLLVLLLLVLIGGGVLLSQWDIAPPAGEITKPIPNERFFGSG
jgi:hypothetical protein